MSATGLTVAAALDASLVRLSPQPGSLLVISGGATAQVILQLLGIDVLDILGATLRGLPIVRGGGLTVVTHSGGFGVPGSLSNLFAPDLDAGKLLRPMTNGLVGQRSLSHTVIERIRCSITSDASGVDGRSPIGRAFATGSQVSRPVIRDAPAAVARTDPHLHPFEGLAHGIDDRVVAAIRMAIAGT